MDRSTKVSERKRKPNLHGVVLVAAICSTLVLPIDAWQSGKNQFLCVKLERLTFERVNRERLGRGLRALRMNPRLVRAARWQSRDMAERHFFTHINPDGYSPKDRAQLAGLRRARLVAENLGLVSGSADPVLTTVEGWLLSLGHRRNMLNPKFKHTGIGVFQAPNGVLYFTQVFADRV